MDALKPYRRIVIKIGSALLVDRETGALRKNWLDALARDVQELTAQGTEILIVSSGAIALGRGELGLGPRTLSLEQSQAAAAVGQIQLARAYSTALRECALKTAQVLVTLEDSANRRRYLNLRVTLEQLLRYGAIPVVNENDTVATDEIRYGDNDRMAAQIAVAVEADLLILLSDVDGLYTASPNIDKNATHISEITKITPEIEKIAGDAGSNLARGGMKTKIMAAKTATNAGCTMVITKGTAPGPLSALMRGAKASWFLPQTDPQSARKDWISAMKPHGTVVIDPGAQSALSAGKSLLPAGVIKVGGDFQRGDMIEVEALNGEVVARGLTRYDRWETDKIKGVKTHEIEALLGYAVRAALIHRDDMVLLWRDK